MSRNVHLRQGGRSLDSSGCFVVDTELENLNIPNLYQSSEKEKTYFDSMVGNEEGMNDFHLQIRISASSAI